MKNMNYLRILIASLFTAVLTASGGQLVTDDLDVMGTASFYGEVNVGFEASALLTNGLALYYSFNTNHGGAVLDNSGNSHTGVVTGATWTNAGFLGSGYYLDGNDYITAGDIFDVTGALTDLTVCVWAKLPNGIGGYPHVVGKQRNGPPYTGWALMLDPSDSAVSLIYGNGVVAIADGSTQVTTGTWHFMCATFKVRSSSMEANIYLDGVREATGTYSGSPGSTDTSALFTIGARDGGALDFFTGYVDELRVYDRALTDSEVTAMYAAYIGATGTLNVKDLIVENELVQTGTGTNILMGPTGIGVTNPVGQLDVGGLLNVNGNIQLNDNWLSGDGDDEGVSVASDGTVTILKMEPQGDIEMGSFTNHP